MALQLINRKIQQISIIDDDPNVRNSYVLPVEDLDVEPILETGPINDLDRDLNSIMEHANAAICDHHLTKINNYSTHLGATLVSEMYKARFPAILCTRYNSASMDEIRPLRRYIPSLLNPSDLESESVEESIKICLNEFDGKFLPTRKPWRALVRVEDVDDTSGASTSFFYVIVPSWDSNKAIKLYKKDMPVCIQDKITSGNRFHAQVNLGAESDEGIYFDPDSWETH